jgi:hypothetical protein
MAIRQGRQGPPPFLSPQPETQTRMQGTYTASRPSVNEFSCFGIGIGSLGRGGRAAPAKEVVQYKGDARGSEQQAAGWTRNPKKIRLIS